LTPWHFTTWLDFLDHRQTLAAGVLAVLAAGGTIWATIKSANREIAASQAQTATAQRQIETTLRLERRRAAREGYAFHSMFEAAMGRVLADAEKARQTCRRTSQTSGVSTIAYEARQCFAKRAFSELLHACVRYGGLMTRDLLDLENDIDDFASKWDRVPTAGEPERRGHHEGLIEQLATIEAKAEHLRQEAAEGTERTRSVLAKTESGSGAQGQTEELALGRTTGVQISEGLG
jgi:hypothetical protein